MLRLLAGAALASALQAQAAVIDEFDVQVTLERDGGFVVSERIAVDFGSEERLGGGGGGGW